MNGTKILLRSPIIIISLGLFAIFVLSVCVDKTNNQPKMYSIKIENEHDLLCINGKDTITLSFENAYVLSEETVVSINIKSQK